MLKLFRRLLWKLIELTDPPRDLRPRGAPRARRNLPSPPERRIPLDQRVHTAIEVVESLPPMDVVKAAENSGAREIPIRRGQPLPVTLTAEERAARQSRK